MARFLAQANLSLGGRLVTWGEVVDLDPGDPEVAACIGAQLLLPELSSGGFAAAPMAPRRCCGG